MYSNAVLENKPVATINLVKNSGAKRDPLFDYILERESNKRVYEDNPLSQKQLISIKEVVGRDAGQYASVMAHVQWVYCAYILLHSHPPGLPEQTTSIADKQRKIKEIIDTKEKARVIQLLTQINGGQRYKNELQRILEAA